MSVALYRYRFSADVPLDEVESSLMLSIWSCAALHGESRVRLETRYSLDEAARSLVIDAAGPIGRDLNRIFVGLLQREFGEDSFRVEGISPTPQVPA